MAIEDYTNMTMGVTPNYGSDYEWSNANKGYLVTETGISELSFGLVGITRFFTFRPTYVGRLDDVFMEPKFFDPGQLDEPGGKTMETISWGTPINKMTHLTKVPNDGWDYHPDATIGSFGNTPVFMAQHKFFCISLPFNMGPPDTMKRVFSIAIEHDSESVLYVGLQARDNPRFSWGPDPAPYVPLYETNYIAPIVMQGREFRLLLRSNNHRVFDIGRVSVRFKPVDSRTMPSNYMREAIREAS